MLRKILPLFLIMLWASSLSAAPPELLFAKGVVAFSQGELDEAARHFLQVLDENDAHVQARAYLGQVELARGRLTQAENHLRRALEQQPDNPALRLDLALALIKMERFGQAEQLLTSASGDIEEQAAFQYYLGHCRYKQGRYAQAMGPLEKARDLDGGFAAAAIYGLGLVHAHLGQREQALAQFESLTGPQGQQQLGELAEANMLALRGTIARSWDLSVSLGGGFDSNVALSTVDTAEAGAPGLFIALGGAWRPIADRRQRLQLDLRLFRSFNFSDETEGFDLSDLSFGLSYGRLLGDSLRITGAYRLDVDLLDDLAVAEAGEGFGLFMHGHEASLGAAWRWSAAAETGLRYRFRAAFFASDQRNHFAHEFLLSQALHFFDGRLHLALAGGLALEDAKGLDWDLWGPVASFLARLKILAPLELWARLDFRREDHHHYDVLWLPGDRRVDNLLSAGAGLNWRFHEMISLGFSYRYLRNLADSVDLPQDPFGYDRHSLSVVLTGRL